MPLPPNTSISLQPHSRPGEGVTTAPKVAMIVRMTEETLNALQSLSGADRMDFEFGDKPGIYVREQFFPMRYDKEKENQELFIRTTMPTRPNNAPLRLNANVVGKFAVEQELSAKFDKFSQLLHNVNAAAARQKEQRKAIMVDTPPVTPSVPQKPAPKRKGPPKSAPKSTPTIVKSYATAPSNQSATSNTSAAALPKELAATYRLRLIHYLALGSATVQDIFKEFGGSEIDHNTRTGIMDLLFDVAEQEQVPRKSASSANATCWRLKPQTWLEIRPYQYSGYTDNVRTKVARSARTWLSSLKIPENDPAWDHVRFRDSGHGNAGSNASPAQRPTNGTTSAAARSKKAKVTNVGVKIKSEAAPPPRPSQAPIPLPTKPSLPSFRSSTPVRNAKGKEREEDTEKEEGELSASQTPPRISSTPVERRQPNSRSNGTGTPTMPPPPIPLITQPPVSQTTSSSTSSKRTGPVDVRGARRPPPEPSEPARAAPPIPPPDRKPIVIKEVKKERALLRQEGNGVATSGSPAQSLKERELAKREKERESDRESIRAARRERERESDRESIRGRDKERAVRERDNGREREQERPKAKLKEAAKVPARPMPKTNTIKRKASESSGEESSDWGYERRPSVKAKRNRESVPAKNVPSSLKMPKREPRDSPPPRQKIKRSASPLPLKPKPVGERKMSSSSKVAVTVKKADGISRPTAVKSHKRRPSIDFTSSSEEEEEELKQKRPMATSKASSSLASKTSSSAIASRSLAPKPTKPRPTLSKHDQLRLRYSSVYGEYISVFQKLVAQKNKAANLLRQESESPSGDSDIDADMMPLDELEELTTRHRQLYNELEGIKKTYLA